MRAFTDWWPAVIAAVFGVAVPRPSGAEVGNYAEVHGIRMYYEVHGRGPALLLLHGGTGNGTQFAQQVPGVRAGTTA